MISRDLVVSQLGEEAEEVVSRGVRKKNYKFGISRISPPMWNVLNCEISFEHIIRIFHIFEYIIHTLHSLRIKMHFPSTYLSQD